MACVHDLCARVFPHLCNLSCCIHIAHYTVRDQTKETRVSDALLGITPNDETAPWGKERLSRRRFAALNCISYSRNLFYILPCFEIS